MVANKKGKDFWSDMKKLNLSHNSSAEIPSNLSDPVALNNYYADCSKVTDTTSREKLLFYDQNKHPSFTEELNFNLIDETSIVKIINSIRTNATGEDGISITDIKLCLPFCIKPLINIINSCILENVYPLIWKKSIIKPVSKISNPTNFNDLRPISILSTISKILEKHIYNQLFSFCVSSNIIQNVNRDSGKIIVRQQVL